ncbi:MAG: TonB-dependent receptor [Sphingomonadales bacterium]|nr:TonB-dependent receptor [Sphingomonadales bacterium]
MRNFRGFVLAGVSGLALATPAFAQDDGKGSKSDTTEEIVVTGTLVRGVQPTGTQVVGVSREAVEASGASTVTQLLQTVPQFGSFNSIQAPVGGGNTVTTNRPNLRNLSASNTNGANSTLMLVDGHRVVGMGILTTTPDLDTIAPGAIERVDIVPDGGSSIYGADAVGGVINFVTRKKFDGIAVDSRFGFADQYNTWDVNATIGKTWDGGGAYISYNYSQHDPLFGRDRGWVQQFATQISGVAIPTLGIECATPNMQVVGNSAIYGLPLSPTAAAKLNQPNQCDYSDFATVYPKEHRHSVFASFTQDLADWLNFEVKAYYMDRQQEAITGYLRATKTIGTGAGQLNSPFRSQNIVSSPTEAHKVSFAFGGADANRQEVSLRTWGVTPTFTAELGSNWRAKVLFNYGQSTTIVHSPTLNDTALSNAIRAGLFNPYAPATSDAATLAAIMNYETLGDVRQTQFETRAVIDGELFRLPGGNIKVAFGAEYMDESLRSQKGNVVPGTASTGFAGLSIGNAAIVQSIAAVPILRASRKVKSVFGELVLPLAADTTLLQELTVSASGRYDDYSDAGHTFNPKIGLTWKPFDQLRIRAQWGKSFAAPSLANSADADPSTATWSTGSTFNIFVSPSGIAALNALGYSSPNATNANILTLGGGSNSLKPQTARTWSLGADLDPVPGVRLSGTYWNVHYKGLIASPVGTAASNPARYFQQFLSSYIIAPSQADINALLSQAKIVNGSPCGPQPQCLYIIEYNTTQNLGNFDQSGLDFSALVTHRTGFGSVDLNVAATYILKRSQSVSATAPMVDQLPNGISRLSMRTVLGAQIGHLRAQTSWNLTGGYDFSPTNLGLTGFYPDQGHVGSFSTIDLFFKYDFAGTGLMKDLALTLGVNNVFDKDPPVRYVGGAVPSQFGYANGSTVGRLVQVGFSKKF